jgi:hypothetical protein
MFNNTCCSRPQSHFTVKCHLEMSSATSQRFVAAAIFAIIVVWICQQNSVESKDAKNRQDKNKLDLARLVNCHFGVRNS